MKQKPEHSFDTLEYEKLCSDLFQSIGELSRYIHKCGLTKNSIVESCECGRDYGNTVTELLEIGDDANSEAVINI